MDQLEDILREFANRIREQVRKEFLAALGGSEVGAGRRAKRTAAAPARKKGGKRDPKELAALTAKLGAAIKSKPGQRIEQIAQAMGVPSKELALSAKKLLAAKAIKTTGNRRATKYFPK